MARMLGLEDVGRMARSFDINDQKDEAGLGTVEVKYTACYARWADHAAVVLGNFRDSESKTP